MSDFSHIAKQAIDKDGTAEYEIRTLSTRPTLVCRYARNNVDYEIAIAKFRKEIEADLRKLRKKYKTKILTPGQILRVMRNYDRRAYVGTVVVDWTTNLDADGNEAEFDEENCTKFLAVLPDDIMDDLRDFASIRRNFSDEDFDFDDEEELAEN